MTKFVIILTVIFISVGLCAQHKPNVIIFITDDQGYGDMSCNGHPILKTPNLDRLYNESVHFTDFHASPYCSPTCASLITGRDFRRVGVWHTFAWHRVTLFIRWTNGLFQSEREIDELTCHMDIFPTLIDLCGLQTEKTLSFDGQI